MTPKNKNESSEQTAWQSWRRAARESPADPLPETRLEQMYEASQLCGSANCWTGTTGDLSTMIRELLRERESLLQALKNQYDEQENRRNDAIERCEQMDRSEFDE